jgi:hypothetical protein
VAIVSNWEMQSYDRFRCEPATDKLVMRPPNPFLSLIFSNSKQPQGVVIGSCDRALGRKARAEGFRKLFRFPARDFAPKPHAHDPVAAPCVDTT